MMLRDLYGHLVCKTYLYIARELDKSFFQAKSDIMSLQILFDAVTEAAFYRHIFIFETINTGNPVLLQFYIIFRLCSGYILPFRIEAQGTR